DGARRATRGGEGLMPRPEPRTISFTIDGVEVQAPENMMLADAAKLGDVEIPVFCYEPKLGQPVGACRMCLVEIEGIPKLQTGCSTAVKDGMVVYTQTERVKTAQRSVVEFLLINHPLDCPVCDKGGECPLQDITFGWGGGISRFIEPKRHFVKPLELSPLVAIDRERCILCYRCVRFSQEVAEDYQLVLLERGAHSYVSTFDGHPYVAPFSGNIVELCPVGALTSRPYRFRARPWDIEESGSVCTLCPVGALTSRNYRFRARPWDVEDAGSVCTLCPSQCNVTLTVRDERVMRVLARDHPAVDDGWLCDRGRFAYPALGGSGTTAADGARILEPLLRDGGELRPVSWERALTEAAEGLRRAGEHTAALVGGEATGEEGFLLARLLREGLRSPHIDSRRAGVLPLELLQLLDDPRLQATVPDLEFAHAVLLLDAHPIADAPILDLRLRKGARRHGLKLISATAADLRERPEDLAAQLRELGEDVVILWAERLTAGTRGEAAARALLELADALSLAGREGAGLLEIPAGANGRGLREAGVLPNAGPGLRESDPELGAGLDAHGIAAALAAGELSALLLAQSDPLADFPHSDTWSPALARATTVIAHASFLTEGLREHANIVLPAQAYPEKEGTVVHPDGRLQRLRPAVAQPGATRAQWRAIADLAALLGLDLQVPTAAAASQQLFEAVPFYAGLTLDEIGGRGVRWQEREAAGAFVAGAPA
ncbi:MAG TPA: molybdopterin-dependent oxidoreductase, partial [Solirubrobacteraceae bacterium]|nr:molybdopterin-dependent oxidoreductase [Solirubrobacteraceae bacterium]